jgi:predicted Na+-dependent transporter
MASQKSSPVALSVITVIASGTKRGLLTIPCILGQLGQIFIGSILVNRLAKWAEGPIVSDVKLENKQVSDDITEEGLK